MTTPNPTASPLQWRVIDSRTGQPIGGMHRTRQAAQRSAERRDLAYGACRFQTRPEVA